MLLIIFLTQNQLMQAISRGGPIFKKQTQKLDINANSVFDHITYLFSF